MTDLVIRLDRPGATDAAIADAVANAAAAARDHGTVTVLAFREGPAAVIAPVIAPLADLDQTTTGGLSQDQWRRLCLLAFENLPADTPVTMNDVDAILTWCLPEYDDMRAAAEADGAPPA